MNLDFNTDHDLINVPFDESLSLYISSYNENMELFQEALNLQNVVQKGKDIAIKTKNNIQRMWRWLVRSLRYLWSTLIRRMKSRKAEKKIKEADAILKKTGQAVYDFSDIPDDIYDGEYDDYEEYAELVKMFEAAGDELAVFGDVNIGDIKTFAKNVILNKKMILNVMSWMVPGVKGAKAAVNAAKAIAVLTPMVSDFIVTSKNIALLKRKYEGKMKRIRDENGNVYIEMPAETHIMIDQYVKLLQRMLDFCKQGGHKEKITMRLANTDDLIKLGKQLLDNAEGIVDDMTKSYDKQIDAVYAKYRDMINALPEDVPWESPECQEIVSQQHKELDQLYKSRDNMVIKSLSSGKALLMMMNLAFDTLAKVASIYVDGEEYRYDKQSMASIFTPYLSELGKLALEMAKEIDQMNLAGMNCLNMFIKVMNTVGSKGVSLGIKMMNDDNIRRSTKDPKFGLVKVHHESVMLEGVKRSSEKVRDGYFGDLPPDIQKKVMDAHKIVIGVVKDLIDEDHYSDLKDSRWAMSCIDDFCVMPKDKDEVGSFRVYKSGKKYKCMIQLTGHFRNHQYGWIEELLHEFVKHVHMTAKIQIRKKLDMSLDNEGSVSNPCEGFDIYPNPKVVQEIWDKMEGRKTKTITENGIVLESDADQFLEASALHYGDHYPARKLPDGLMKLVRETNILIYDTFKELSKDPKYSALTSREKDFKKVLEQLDGTGHRTEIGFTSITDPDEDIKVTIVVTPEPRNMLTSWSSGGDSAGAAQNALRQLMQATEKKLSKTFHKKNPTKYLELVGDEDKEFFAILCYADYAMRLKNHLDDPKNVPYTEATAPGVEYNANMSETEARKALRALSQNIISNRSKKVTQYTANIYANIITKNLLSRWAPGYQRFSITLDDYQSFNYFNFRVPKMTNDFVGRFIEGREKLEGLLHRNPEIKVKMSPRLFSNMTNPDDAFNFFKAAIKYYDTSVEKYARALMAEVMKLDRPTKNLIATTKLSGIVTLPMSLIFSFDDVKMSNTSIFKISQSDIKAVNQFVRNITTRYAAPEKEKAAIIKDLKEMISSLRDVVSNMNENVGELSMFPETVQQYYTGKFDSNMESFRDRLYEEQVDYLAMRTNPNPQARYITEKFGVKKLKKIPSDLVAYITIETESIKDANDKMMIASYCLGKIEIVEWYIELLEVGSKKYIVPHNKPYLESVRTQLLACYKKIMATPIPKATGDRPLIDIQYPKGYEG